jgi:hypothetical protein
MGQCFSVSNFLLPDRCEVFIVSIELVAWHTFFAPPIAESHPGIRPRLI